MKEEAEYFEQALNEEVVREARINVVCYRRMPMLGDLNEMAILIEEVREAVNEMKSGKFPCLDGFPVECLRNVVWHARTVSETV